MVESRSCSGTPRGARNVPPGTADQKATRESKPIVSPRNSDSVRRRRLGIEGDSERMMQKSASRFKGSLSCWRFVDVTC